MLQVVAGGFTLDDTVLLDDRVVRRAPGGNVLYAGVGALLAGVRPALLARIGEDYPAGYLGALDDAGLLLDGCRRVAGPSIHLWVLHEGSNRRQLVPRLDSGTNDRLDPRPEDIPAAYRSAEAVHVAGIPIESQAALVGSLAVDGKVISLDAPHVPLDDGGLHRLERVLAQATIFLPSREELRNIWGLEPGIEACRRLADLGPDVVAIKLGDAGSLVWSKVAGRGWRVPIFPTDTVDMTGAGDAYCGALCATYASTSDARAAAASGTAAASFVVEDFGGLHALRTRPDEFDRRFEDVLERIEEV